MRGFFCEKASRSGCRCSSRCCDRDAERAFGSPYHACGHHQLAFRAACPGPRQCLSHASLSDVAYSYFDCNPYYFCSHVRMKSTMSSCSSDCHPSASAHSWTCSIGSISSILCSWPKDFASRWPPSRRRRRSSPSSPSYASSACPGRPQWPPSRQRVARVPEDRRPAHGQARGRAAGFQPEERGFVRWLCQGDGGMEPGWETDSAVVKDCHVHP